MKRLLKIASILTLTANAVYASPGWSEGSWTKWDGAFFMAILIFNVSFLPLVAMEGTFRFGLYSWAQIPIQVICVVSLVLLLNHNKARLRFYLILAPIVYVIATFGSNVLGMRYFEVDHRNDFPIGKYLTELNVSPPRTRDQIIAHAGQPIDERSIDESTDIQPRQIQEAMRNWKRTNALVSVYQESASHGRQNTYYILFDVATTQQFTYMSIHRPLSENDWPNKGFQAIGAKARLQPEP